ncbi:MAG: efflux RND transporter periplasmic adaptor subunit, partial [Caulobacteraceae bacterium]
MSETTSAPRAKPPPPKDRSNRRAVIGIAAVILAALALALILSHCARGGAAKRGGRGATGGGPGGRPPITVGTAKAVTATIPIQVSALGTVTPLATVNVNARVAGMLLTVNFREGQLVRKGQLLAQIDPRPFQVAVQQARGQLLRDLALLADAKLDLARFRTLRAQDSIAGQQVDTQAALVKQDEATVSTDQAAVASAQLNLSFTHITAPVSGRVGLRQIDPGNQITANAALPIAVVAQIDPIAVIFSLPEEDIP